MLYDVVSTKALPRDLMWFQDHYINTPFDLSKAKNVIRSAKNEFRELYHCHFAETLCQDLR